MGHRIWTDSEIHTASLKLPSVREGPAKGRPLITGMGARIVTEPVAGV